jgi:catechol 2,3-dioxygenase-like lactoylglutathione lyase family enzyme
MARDVAESARFFATLGFTLEFLDDPAAPRYAGLRRGAVELHLQWGDPTQWEHRGDRPAYRFPTADVDALFAEFEGAGLAPGSGPYRTPAGTPWGTREFHVRDPGGNVLQFHQPLG